MTDTRRKTRFAGFVITHNDDQPSLTGHALWECHVAFEDGRFFMNARNMAQAVDAITKHSIREALGAA